MRRKSICNTLLVIVIQLIWIEATLCNESGIPENFETIFIEIKTDSFPTETSWILFDEFDNQILSNNQFYYPDSIYQFSVTVGDDVCHKVAILDAGGNGIGGSGYYKIERAGLEIVYNYSFSDSLNYHYSGDCGFGDSCAVAAEITNNVMYGKPLQNYWYYYTPTSDAFYEINTCLNIDTSTSQHLDTEIWIYDYCPYPLPQGPTGAIAYSVDYTFCTPAAGWNALLLKKDTTYYIRVGLVDTAYTERVGLKFQEIPSIYGCMDPSSCNYNPIANFDDGSCYFTSSCMPDLEIDTAEFMNSIYLDSLLLSDPCLIEEFCVTGLGQRYLVRFSTLIKNIGGSDYIVGNPVTNPGNFSDDNCHGHWHDLGYAEYLLYAGAGLPQPLGFKNGFCVMDLGCQQGATAKYNCTYMGLSAGCSDYYEAALDCQWLDVTDVADGNYTLVIRVNWDQAPDWRGFSEINYTNNWAQACINLDRSSGQLQLTVSAACPTYFDCAGVANGTAVFDCTGICGGNAVEGDLNGNNGLDTSDINGYYYGVIPNTIPVSPCTDLNGDGQISLYDAVLIDDCYQDKIANAGYPIHTHCLFPGGVIGLDSVSLRLAPGFDIADGFVDIEYLSKIKKLAGFQFSLSGITISQVMPNSAGNSNSILDYNSNEILMFEPDSLKMNALNYEPLARVYFNNVTDVKICLDQIQDIIDEDHYKMLNDSIGNCHFLQSSPSYELINHTTITVSPSLVSHDLIYINSEKELTGNYQFYDYTGKCLGEGLFNNTKKQTIGINQLPTGLIILKFKQDHTIHTFKLIKTH